MKTYNFDEEDFEVHSLVNQSLEPSEFSQFKEEISIPGQEQLEDLFKFISETELSKQAKNLLNPLITLIESCESYEDLYEILKEENLRSKTFEQNLQKAIFLCELQGRVDGLD